MRTGDSQTVRRRQDRGAVLVTTALMLVPLMIFVAFAVDIGSFFSAAAKIQRASDAGALAAVVHMPDEAQATTAARDAAARNGYIHGVDGVTVSVSSIGTSDVRVDINTTSPTYFAKVFVDEVAISRGSTASYVDAVPMGNPTSALGTADLDLEGVDTPANYWLNAHAYTMGVAAGDLLNSNASNPFYNDRGYLYAINAKAGVSTDIQVLHSGSCKRPNWPQNRGERQTSGTPTIEFDLFTADSTPRNHEDNIVPALQWGSTWTTDHSGNTVNDSTGDSCPEFAADGTWIDPKWITMFTIPAPATDETWYLTAGTPPSSTGHKNMYGIRLISSNLPAGSSFCSALDPATVSFGDCPTLTALDRLAVYIGENRPDPSSTVSAASFYFAEIDAVHAGKTLSIQLWDPGEGSQYLQFMDPFGLPMPFRYRIEDRYGTQVVDWVDTAGPCSFDPSTTSCMPAAHHDRMITIQIDVAKADGSTYTCDGTNCWWKVNYASTNDVDDTTTWAIDIVGSPIRLIE